MKIGNYVRTRTGYFGKIININEFREPSMKYGIDFQGADDIIFIGDEHIVKSSSNIIDLIEEHDLLKLYDRDYGEEYIAEVILEDKNMLCVHNYECSDLLILEYEFITNEHIKLKSIVTKEQFEKSEYKVGD